MNEQNKKTKCRIKAPGPEVCGYSTWELVRQKAEEYPHLRPCPKKNWWWMERKNCLECENKIEE